MINLLATSNISVIEELIKFVGDNGIMMVISAIVVYFMIKVLNSMLAQNSSISAQILPKLNELEKSLTDIVIKLNENETRRNLSYNKQTSEIKESHKDMMNDLKTTNKKIEKLNTLVSSLSEEIEKQNMYVKFLQEQLKDRGD